MASAMFPAWTTKGWSSVPDNAAIRREIVDRWKKKFHYHWCHFRKKECDCRPKVQEACERLRGEPWIIIRLENMW